MLLGKANVAVDWVCNSKPEKQFVLLQIPRRGWAVRPGTQLVHWTSGPRVSTASRISSVSGSWPWPHSHSEQLTLSPQKSMAFSKHTLQLLLCKGPRSTVYSSRQALLHLLLSSSADVSSDWRIPRPPMLCRILPVIPGPRSSELRIFGVALCSVKRRQETRSSRSRGRLLGTAELKYQKEQLLEEELVTGKLKKEHLPVLSVVFSKSFEYYKFSNEKVF